MIKRSLWKLQIAEPGNTIISYLFSCLPLQTDLLEVKLYYFSDGVSWSDFAVYSIDTQLIFDSIEIPPGNFNLYWGNVPTFMPYKSSFLLEINFFLHWNINIQFRFGFILFKLDSVLWLQNLEHLILILFIRSFNGQIAVHPTPLFSLCLHFLQSILCN